MSDLGHLIEAAQALTVLLLDDMGVALDEAKPYYMEDVTLKRWILGDGGQAGNCDDCEENADEGWIEESEFFPAGDIPVDEPPLHPHDSCTVEYRDTTRRVYI